MSEIMLIIQINYINRNYRNAKCRRPTFWAVLYWNRNNNFRWMIIRPHKLYRNEKLNERCIIALVRHRPPNFEIEFDPLAKFVLPISPRLMLQRASSRWSIIRESKSSWRNSKMRDYEQKCAHDFISMLVIRHPWGKSFGGWRWFVRTNCVCNR